MTLLLKIQDQLFGFSRSNLQPAQTAWESPFELNYRVRLGSDSVIILSSLWSYSGNTIFPLFLLVFLTLPLVLLVLPKPSELKLPLQLPAVIACMHLKWSSKYLCLLIKYGEFIKIHFYFEELQLLWINAEIPFQIHAALSVSLSQLQM